jgi:hypothetical protein
MIFALSAQIIDTVIIRTSLYAMEKSAGAVWWAGSSLYHWYSPPPKILSETEELREEVHHLRDEIEYIRHQSDPSKEVIMLDE